jgi:hypothetical protein
MSLFTSSSRAFLWSFLILVLGAGFTFAAATEWLIREKIVPYHSYYKYRDLFRDSRAVNAIFGDSHAANGLTGLDGFVNLAYSGENFQSIAGKVRLYFADKQPGRVILQAGFHHFSRNFLDFRPNETKLFRDFLAGRVSLLRILEPVHAKELMNYWKVFLDKGRFTPKETFMPDGSRLSQAVYTDRPARQRRAAEARTIRILEPIAGFRDTSTAREYQRIIDELRRRGGEICLVSFPAADTLRRGIIEGARFRAVRKYFTALARRDGVRYVNLLDRALPLEFFADPHHVNARGARVISRRVATECFPATERPA